MTNKNLTRILDQYEGDLAVLEALEAKGLSPRGSKRYYFIGFLPFDDGNHWSSDPEDGDADGVLKDGIESLLYSQPGIKQTKEFNALRAAYDTAREEIARREGISLNSCTSWCHPESRQFLDAQKKPEYRPLVRAVIGRIKDIESVL
jgi:hypothetical protein